jgi:hypothetical protein
MDSTIAYLIVSLLVAAAFLFGLLRHAVLTALTVLGPLAGYLIVKAAAAAGWLIAPHLVPVLGGLLVAGLMVDEFVVARAGGDSAASAMRSASRDVPVLLAVVVLWALCSFAQHVTEADSAVAAAKNGVSLLIVLAVVVSVLQLARFLPFGEDFIARTNRFREKAERLVDRLLIVSQPRWALSLCGIAAVLLTVVAFRRDHGQAIDLTPASLLWPAIFLIALLFLSAVVRDWRLALAGSLAWALAFALSFPDSTILPMLLVGVAISRIAPHLRAGDEMSLAVSRALSRSGLGLAVVSLAAFAAFLTLAVAFRFTGEYRPFHVLRVGATGFLCPLIFLPAFAVTIETFFPRRGTLEARYRVH